MRSSLIIIAILLFFLAFHDSNEATMAEDSISSPIIDFTMEPINKPLDRDNYRPFDFEDTSTTSGNEEQSSRVRKNIMDPLTVVMHKYINGPYTPDKISLFFPKGPLHKFNARGDGAKWEEDYIVFVLLYDPVRGDDSVSGEEIRLDFKKVDDQWEVVWSGKRFRCGRGENKGEWTRQLCP